MLTLYRRHLGSCGHRSFGFRKCKCPVWANGVVRGEFVRKSLKTRNWEAGQRTIREWEITGSEKASGIRLGVASERFYADCEARMLKNPTRATYKLLLGRLMDDLGDVKLGRITVEDLREHREKWEAAPATARARIVKIRSFFRFCQESGWIPLNPAKSLNPPKESYAQKLPYTDEEFEKILWATEVYPDRPKGRRLQVRVFILVLRYTGIRLGDAVSLREEYVREGKLFLKTGKTG